MTSGPSATSAALWVILDGSSLTREHLAHMSLAGATVLVLSDDWPGADTTALRAAGVHVEAGWEWYRPFFEDARAAVVRLTARVSNLQVDGRALRERLAWNGTSLWWLVGLSQRNPEDAFLFRLYCVSDCLRRYLRHHPTRRLQIVGGSPWSRYTLQQIATAENVLCEGGLQRPPSLSALTLAARRLRAVARLGLRLWVAKRAARASTTSPVDACIAIHTWYPSQWLPWKRQLRDRYVVDTADVFEDRGLPVRYAATLAGLSVRELCGVLGRLADLPDTIAGREVWIESTTSWTEFLKVCVDIRGWRAVTRRGGVRRQLRTCSIEEIGIDVSEALLDDIRFSLAVQLPALQLLAAQMRRFVQRFRPAAVITIMETYAYGRALMAGVRGGEAPDPMIFGLQCGPASSNQLFYRYERSELTGPLGMPTPDYFLLHGSAAEQMLLAAGVARERLLQLGAPRLAEHLSHRDRRAAAKGHGLKPAGGARTILVAGSIWPEDTDRLLGWSFAAASEQPHVRLVIKPHPGHKNLDGSIAALSAAFPSVHWQLSHEPLNDLQVAADLMITGDSSGDVEAVLIGCPAIKTTGTFGWSPLADHPGLVRHVSSARELSAALAEDLTAKIDSSIATAIFGRLDGGAAERIADAVARLITIPQCRPVTGAVVRARSVTVAPV